jgi:hypothetical protein
MALFIILPFLGGWIGYTYAPEKVVEVERVVVREVEVEKNVEAKTFIELSREVMFSISNVQVDSVVAVGDRVTVTWDYVSGTDPKNAYLNFQLVNIDGVVLSRGLRGAGYPDLYKVGSTTLAIPTLCSDIPTEGCIDDGLFVVDQTYSLKVVGRSCVDGETLPGYCDYNDTQMLQTEPVYSSEFTLQ